MHQDLLELLELKVHRENQDNLELMATQVLMVCQEPRGIPVLAELMDYQEHQERRA